MGTWRHEALCSALWGRKAPLSSSRIPSLTEGLRSVSTQQYQVIKDRVHLGACGLGWNPRDHVLHLPVQLVLWGLTLRYLWFPRDRDAEDLAPGSPGVLSAQWYCKWDRVPKQGQSNLLPEFPYHLRKLLEPRALSAPLLKCPQCWLQLEGGG